MRTSIRTRHPTEHRITAIGAALAIALALAPIACSSATPGTVIADAAVRCRDTTNGSAIEPAILLDIESPSGVPPEDVIAGVFRRDDGQRVCDFEYGGNEVPASSTVDGSGFIACGTTGSTTTASRVVLSYEAHGAPGSIYKLQATWVLLRDDGIVGNHYCNIDVTDLRQ